jgi:hypothetical protein
MDNPTSTSTPISNQASNPSSPLPSTEQKNSSPQNKPNPQNIGGDQKNDSKQNEVKKENKDVTAG